MTAGLLTADQAAEIAGCTRQAIYQACWRHTARPSTGLAHSRHGGAYVITPDALADWMRRSERHRQAARRQTEETSC